jgi:hypothetical protein
MEQNDFYENINDSEQEKYLNILNDAKFVLDKTTKSLKDAEKAYFNTTDDDDDEKINILRTQYEQADNDFYNACVEYEYAENIYETLCDILKKLK